MNRNNNSFNDKLSIIMVSVYIHNMIAVYESFSL
jgi:hypothetical protein